MKIALITDLHFGARNDNLTIYENQKRFFDDVFFPYIEDNSISTIINLGDTFDRRKMINTDILHRSRRDIFSKMNKYDCHFLVGNHDTYWRSSNKVNSISECLSDLENIKVYSEPCEVKIGNSKLCFIPWINSENKEQTENVIRNSTSSVCFGHLELIGFEFHKGSICKHGIDPKLFSDHFSKTISGHFHKRSDTKHITYLGTAYQTTWIEYDEIKGFHVFDTDDNTLEFVMNPYNLFEEIEYPIVNIPEIKDKFVRIVVREEDSKTSDYSTFLTKIQSMEPHMLQTKLIDLLTITNDCDTKYNDLKLLDFMTIADDYISNIENFSNIEKLKEEFQNLYREVSNC